MHYSKYFTWSAGLPWKDTWRPLIKPCSKQLSGGGEGHSYQFWCSSNNIPSQICHHITIHHILDYILLELIALCSDAWRKCVCSQDYFHSQLDQKLQIKNKNDRITLALSKSPRHMQVIFQYFFRCFPLSLSSSASFHSPSSAIILR